MRSSYPRRERPLQGLCYPVVYHGVVVAQNDRAKGCVVVDVFVAVGIEERGAGGFSDNKVRQDVALRAVHAARDDLAGFVVKTFAIRGASLPRSHSGSLIGL